MSDLTTCNFCRLQNLRRQAENTDNAISTKNGNPLEGLPAGIDIYMHSKKLKGAGRFQKQYKVTWFMELTDKCVC